jgi:hypothetical protein
MAKKNFFRGMLALALAFSMAAAGCSDGSSDGDSSGGGGTSGSLPAAKGKLTVNGLSAYDGKYIWVSGLAGGTALFGCTNITGFPSATTYVLVKISGGTAAVPLYYLSGANYAAYEGNDTLGVLSLYILENGTLKQTEVANLLSNNIAVNGVTEGTFSGGNLTVDWGTP